MSPQKHVKKPSQREGFFYNGAQQSCLRAVIDADVASCA